MVTGTGVVGVDKQADQLKESDTGAGVGPLIKSIKSCMMVETVVEPAREAEDGNENFTATVSVLFALHAFGSATVLRLVVPWGKVHWPHLPHQCPVWPEMTLVVGSFSLGLTLNGEEPGS